MGNAEWLVGCVPSSKAESRAGRPEQPPSPCWASLPLSTDTSTQEVIVPSDHGDCSPGAAEHRPGCHGGNLPTTGLKPVLSAPADTDPAAGDRGTVMAHRGPQRAQERRRACCLVTHPAGPSRARSRPPLSFSGETHSYTPKAQLLGG